MDESSMRREQLEAFRREAAIEAEPRRFPASPGQLFNPLNHPPPSPVPVECPTAPSPRFNCYTDPVFSLSGAKRRCIAGGNFTPLSHSDADGSPLSHSDADVGPRKYHIINTQVPVTPKFYVNQSPDQRSHPVSLPNFQSNQWRSPVQFGSPYSGHRGTQFSGPAVWNVSGGSSGHVYPANSSRGGFRSPSSGQQFSPRTSLGRGGSHVNSSGIGSPHSKSNRDAWTCSSSPGTSGGGGQSFDGGRLDSREAGHFYCRSMLADPWKDLEPIVGNILVPRAGSDFWLPKSLKTTVKANLAESSNEVKTQSSLAECLALSFEEAMNDEKQSS